MAKLSRGLRNNNPGNIRLSSTTYQGEVKSEDTAFKAFKSMAYGYRAMFVLLYTYQKKHHLDTIADMIGRYAPATENHTTAYIKAVSEWSGVPSTCHITATNGDVMIPIVSAMSRVENGTEAVMGDVEKGWKLFIADYRNHLL
jgi:hypothetical protein